MGLHHWYIEANFTTLEVQKNNSNYHTFTICDLCPWIEEAIKIFDAVLYQDLI